jgi:hypothetical protein
MQEAHKGIIEAEASAHKGNVTAVSAVAKAHDVLRTKQKEALSSSKENVNAAHAVAQAQRGISTAEQKLSHDQGQVQKDTLALSVAQQAAAAPPKALAAASAKLAAAHEHLSSAEKTLQKDSTSTQKVMEALHRYLGGQAVAYTKTAAGQWAILKAKWNESAVTMGHELLPVLLQLAPVMKSLIAPIGLVMKVFGALVAGIVRGAAEFGAELGRLYYGSVKPFAEHVGKAVGDVVGFFVSLPGKVVNALAGLAKDMFNLGKNLVVALINGITNAPGAIVKAVEGLIPGGSVIGEAAKIVGLAAGGIVTKPTLAVVGEAGPEAVVPLKNIQTKGVQPLGGTSGGSGAPTGPGSLAGGSGGLHIGTMVVNGPQMSPNQMTQELYLKVRPLLQGA